MLAQLLRRGGVGLGFTAPALPVSAALSFSTSAAVADSATVVRVQPLGRSQRP